MNETKSNDMLQNLGASIADFTLAESLLTGMGAESRHVATGLWAKEKLLAQHPNVHIVAERFLFLLA